ncbi:hypothetical protein [Paraburkholderia sp. HP33-1]|uniref:hypothetical protein n=1 Tax=Paraburkholderia sp. HP33-1 TaxID=2883243 RepID=UPI001F38097F|nr:hypothetical protein [Paraburkholderia sp. HP33-1]
MDVMSSAASLLGTRLTLWLGPTIAVPAPALIVEALSHVEVTLSDGPRDGFQLVFTVGRTGVLALDYALLSNPLLRPSTRVVVQVWLGVFPQVLIDGFIMDTHLEPSEQPGASTLTVIGEDVRVMMDIRQTALNYPGESVASIVEQTLLTYSMYLGTQPIIIPVDPSIAPPTEQIPTKSDTDLSYLLQLAHDYGCVFYVEPTAAPMVNLAYWGPLNLTPPPQTVLSVNMGPETNAKINFRYDSRKPALVVGAVIDETTGVPIPLATLAPTLPPLAALPPLALQPQTLRMVAAEDVGGLSFPQALLRAQAQTNNASHAVLATGELDMLRYGTILRPRRLVSVRGAGYMHDGFYYVKSVTHSIGKGEYRQSFTLTREGLGSLTPVVPT